MKSLFWLDRGQHRPDQLREIMEKNVSGLILEKDPSFR